MNVFNVFRLESLGGKLLSPRQDVDQEDWHSIDQWMEGVQAALATLTLDTRQDYIVVQTSDSGWGRNRPFFAKLKVRNIESVQCYHLW